MPRFKVGDARLHYLDIGEGPAIVLVHGLGGQLRNFTYALTERLPHNRLIVIDRPRSGYSTVPAGVEPGLGEQAVDNNQCALRRRIEGLRS